MGLSRFFTNPKFVERFVILYYLCSFFVSLNHLFIFLFVFFMKLYDYLLFFIYKQYSTIPILAG
ncbi:MAG: hypothetical protein A2X08_00020 [Bacteroidetes bacterium GWA2_32_17]|nr:MAG: hypothetical protein A2X08_00020 [Bacteroidetes bacterium GWA2_32_17]